MVDDIVVGEGTIRPHEPRIVAVVAEVVRARRYSPVGMVDTDADAVVDITLRVDKIRPIAPTCVRVRRFSRRKSILYNFQKIKYRLVQFGMTNVRQMCPASSIQFF